MSYAKKFTDRIRIIEEVQDQVPGISAVNVETNDAAGEQLPVAVNCEILVDEEKFDYSAFTKFIAKVSHDFVCRGNVFRGMLGHNGPQFRITLTSATNNVLLRKGFRFIGILRGDEGQALADLANDKLNIACHHLLDALRARANADPASNLLYIAYAQAQILQCLAMLARRSQFCDGIAAPFGPYQTAAHRMIIARQGADEPFFATLEAIESIREFIADVSSQGCLKEPLALEVLRTFCDKQGFARRSLPAWYGGDRAAIYDDVRELPHQVTALMGKIVSEFGGGAAAELGCGTGRLCLALASGLERIFAVDRSEDMLDRLVEKLHVRGLRHVFPILASMGATGLPPSSVDFVLEFEAFFLFPNPARLCAEIRRILRPGGNVIRLVKLQNYDAKSELALQRYDEVVAEANPDGICMVGENIDSEIDHQLAIHEIQSFTFEVLVHKSIRVFEDVLSIRHKRAFPYLEHVPESVLERAQVEARRNAPERVCTYSTYYLVIAFGADFELRRQRVVRLLDTFITGQWRQMANIPSCLVLPGAESHRSIVSLEGKSLSHSEARVD